MSTSTEGCYAKLSGIGGLATVLALIFGIFAWRHPYILPAPVSVTKESTPEDPRPRPGDAAGGLNQTKETDPEPQDSPSKRPAREDRGVPLPSPRPTPAPELPIEFMLR